MAVLPLLGRTDMCFEIPGEGGTGKGGGGSEVGRWTQYGGLEFEAWRLALWDIRL